LIMRLTTVFLIATLMQISAASLAQRITLKEQNVPLEEVLKQIRRQSGYDIFFNGQLLENTKNVTVNITNANIEEALNATLQGLPLTYKLEGTTLTIVAKSHSSLAQDIFGRVIDDEGKPIPNASIRIKGTNTVTHTDQYGEFEMKGVHDDAILTVSYMGFKTLEIAVKNAATPLEIKLNRTTMELEEVKVTYSTG